MSAPLSSSQIDLLRRLRASGRKLSDIASEVGCSIAAAHYYVRGIDCPVNFQSMALRRQVSASRAA